MSILDLIILALATFRLSSLFANEDGPFDLFARVRHWVGVRYDMGSNVITPTVLSKGIVCVWCNSVWFGIILTVVYVLWQPFIWLFVPFALSSVAIIIYTFVDKQ